MMYKSFNYLRIFVNLCARLNRNLGHLELHITSTLATLFSYIGYCTSTPKPLDALSVRYFPHFLLLFRIIRACLSFVH